MNIRIWRMRLSATFLKKHESERELDEDIREHLAFATEENIRGGMNPQDAADAARRSFGGRDQMKEEYRDRRGIPMLETLGREMRFAFRSLLRAPAFAILAILTLALGIGANSAIFSAVNALLFHPAGISQPGRVVVVRSKYDRLNLKNLVISYNDFEDVSNSRDTFAAAAIAKTGSFNYNGGEYPQRLQALRVSSKWFEVFGISPARGRLFTEREDEPGANRVAILGDAAWKRVFGSDPAIIGKTIELDQVPFKVVGIMRPEYTASVSEIGGAGGQAQDVFLPLAFRPTDDRLRYTETFLGVARLQRGVTPEGAAAYMGAVTSRGFQNKAAGFARKINGWGLSITPYTTFSGGDMKTPLLILWGAVGLVLLIACANIAGLTLARTSARSRELAVRTALGGSRWQLLRQLFAESLLVGIAGTTAGLGVAYVFIQGVESWGPSAIAGGLKIPFDLSMIAFTAGAGFLSAVLFGIAPAGQLRRNSNAEGLKEGGRSGTAGRERVRLRSALVTAEVALALVLSIGSGLLLRSLSRLQHVDVGFRPEGVMSASLTLAPARYKDAASVNAFYRSALARLSAIPGVKSVALAYPVPFGEGSEGRPFQVTGRPARPNQPALLAQVRAVTPEFFAALRIPVKRGRTFTDQDALQSEKVIVIDELLAQQYWPGEDPVGQRITPMGGSPLRIVGVVGHTRQSDLASDSESGVFYYSLYQDPVAFGTFVVSSNGNGPPVSASAIRDAVNAVDPAQSIYDAKTMEQRVSATLASRRFTVVLLALFAMAAVFLAALGLYGVINYGVTQRTQEIGIRMALGARRSQVLMFIVGKGIRITLIGLALGACAAFSIARLLPDQLFGVRAFDPMTFGAMAIFLAAVALFASYVPARRAVHLDPLEACRHE
jgi:macrolide transport system ATP-binding/permease protein